MNRDMLSRRLMRKGFDVDIAENGALGVSSALAHPPDVILMDMNMPVLDGWEATKQLKNSEVTRDIPVVALTAHAMDGDRERTLEAGCSDYVPKPVDLPLLLEKIENLLAQKIT